MMLLFFCFMFGDFTFTSAPGSWIDPVRTHRLSANRFLVVVHSGEAGDYRANGGGQQIILDQAGRQLYELGIAKGAWAVRNSIAGDEDTYLYQLHDSNTWHLWHPVYGDRPLKVLGRDVAEGVVQEAMLLMNAGRRIVVLGKKYDPTDPREWSLHLEILDLSDKPIASLMSATELPLKAYLNTDINVPEYRVYDNKIIISEPLGDTLLILDPATFSTDANYREVKLTYQPLTFAMEAGFVSYMGNYQGEWAFICQKVDDPQPLFVLTEADKEKPGYDELRSLFSDLGQGHMTLQDGILYYQFKDRLIAYDTVNNRLEHYSAPETIPAYGHVLQDKLIKRSSSQLSVIDTPSALQQMRTSRPSLLRSIDVNVFKKPI